MNDTLGEFLRDKASECGDRPALLYRPRYRTDIWSYRRLLDESGRVACWLQARGVAPGQRVVLWAPNSPWWVAAFFGALRCGAIVVPLDMRSGPDFRVQVFDQTEPALALVAGPIDAPPAAASGTWKRRRFAAAIGIRRKSGTMGQTVASARAHANMSRVPKRLDAKRSQRS